MGVHEFDQARWLTGSDFTSMSSVASPAISDPEVTGDPDSAQVLCATTSGATVFVSLGRHYRDGDMASVEVFGSNELNSRPWSSKPRPSRSTRTEDRAVGRASKTPSRRSKPPDVRLTN